MEGWVGQAGRLGPCSGAPIVDPILERGGPKAQLCRGFQNMKFDGQRYTTIEIDDPIVDPIGDLKA